MKEARRWGSLAVLSLLLLSIGAVIAIPDFGCATMASNPTAAIATLRSLVAAQARFQAFARCDLDGDGTGEYGTFAEMTAAAGIRGDLLGRSRGAPLDDFYLSPALANADADGVVTKSGYAFRIFLPAKGGGAAREGRGGHPLDRPVDIDAAETSWCAYAWPVASKVRDHRVFFVAGRGDVLSSSNDDLRYLGPDRGPAWDGAFPAGRGAGWAAPPEVNSYAGRDGNVWRRTN